MTLSIVTINYNNLEGLKKTLESVRNQTSGDFEHVLVDGASTDGSAALIKEYASPVPYPVKWVSEKDSGIYNAMNKGIRMASGDYIQILNSGDCLAASNVINRMCVALSGNDFPDILYGNMIFVDGNKEYGKSRKVEYSLRQYFTSTLNHDCAYIRRSLFNEYGLYDEGLKIVSDWKWYLQAIGFGKVKPVYVNIDVTLFDCSGISSTNVALRKAERRKVLEELFPPAILVDYDSHAFEMAQMTRLRSHHLYGLVWFIERVCSKLEKWGILKKS